MSVEDYPAIVERTHWPVAYAIVEGNMPDPGTPLFEEGLFDDADVAGERCRQLLDQRRARGLRGQARFLTVFGLDLSMKGYCTYHR